MIYFGLKVLSMIMSVDAIKLKVHFMRCVPQQRTEAMFDWTCLRFHRNYVLLMWRDNYIVIISYIYHHKKNYIIFFVWIICMYIHCMYKHILKTFSIYTFLHFVKVVGNIFAYGVVFRFVMSKFKLDGKTLQRKSWNVINYK